jgi:hypothetical protein
MEKNYPLVIISCPSCKAEITSICNVSYAPEKCGLCKGIGLGNLGQCKGCAGGGFVLIAQPAQKCGQCKGLGVMSNGICKGCGGCGWACRKD